MWNKGQHMISAISKTFLSYWTPIKLQMPVSHSKARASSTLYFIQNKISELKKKKSTHYINTNCLNAKHMADQTVYNEDIFTK